MKKMFLVMLSLLVVAMFLVGCAQEKVSDEELEAELSELSAGELDEAIETVEAQDTGALAGQAYMKRIPKIPRNIPKEKFLKTAYKVKSLKLIEPPCPANYIYLAQDNYLIQVNSPPYGQCGFASASDYYACGASFIPENACSEGFALKPLGVAYKKVGIVDYEQHYRCEWQGEPTNYKVGNCGNGFEVINSNEKWEIPYYDCKTTNPIPFNEPNLETACKGSFASEMISSGLICCKK